ncbi:hypothetical protein GF337_06295 [candidate division KSB1 bacterium]|nr:hypothetical protein [candidate division KSB1 bacterium]
MQSTKFGHRKINFSFLLIIAINAAVNTYLIYGNPLRWQRNYDIQHIKLNLAFDRHNKSITGEATLTIVPLKENFRDCIFHAADMEIREIQLNESMDVDFEADSEIVRIELPKEFSLQDTLDIRISYFTIPERGIYFNLPTSEDPKIPFQIFSHSEPIDARYWFPCYDQPDDKLTSEVIVTVDSQFTVLSNGKLVSKKINQKTGEVTFHWYQDQPHVTYLISFVIGEYEVIHDQFRDIPLQYYIYKKNPGDALICFEKTPVMISIFEKLYGMKYPWNKYAQVVVYDYVSRGMEHTTATTLTDKIIHDRRTYIDINNDGLIAHELAHQWFGNLVTCESWKHIWLNEGFATFSEILYEEQARGAEYGQYEVILQQQFYMEMESTDFYQPVIYDMYLHPEDMFNHVAYHKASLVLHMLRHVIGDSLFYRGLQDYLRTHSFQSVESIDFIKIMEQTTGDSLSWFFDQWLNKGGYPQFNVEYEWQTQSNLVELRVRQTQSDSTGMVPVFKLPVDFEIVTRNEVIKETRWTRSRSDTFHFQVTAQPKMVRFDKQNAILKYLTFIKTQDESIYQLLHDDQISARLDAIDQLQKNTIDTTATIEALGFCLKNDSFWAVRERAAAALDIFPDDKSKIALIAGCADTNSKVRTTSIRNLMNYDDPSLFPVFRQLVASDSSYFVRCEALYAMIDYPDSLSFEFLMDFVNQDSFNDMVSTAAFECLRELKDKRALPIARSYAADSLAAFYRRYSALRLIEEIGINDPQVEVLLIGLLNDYDEKIKRKVIQILSNFKTPKTLKALKKFDKQELSDGVRRRLRYAIQKIEDSRGEHVPVDHELN